MKAFADLRGPGPDPSPGVATLATRTAFKAQIFCGRSTVQGLRLR